MPGNFPATPASLLTPSTKTSPSLARAVANCYTCASTAACLIWREKDSPAMQLPHVSAGWLVSVGIAAAFEILFPLALAMYVGRRLHVRCRYFWYGVAVFGAVQLFTRVP